MSTPETYRAAYRNIINWIQLHLDGQLLNTLLYCIELGYVCFGRNLQSLESSGYLFLIHYFLPHKQLLRNESGLQTKGLLNLIEWGHSSVHCYDPWSGSYNSETLIQHHTHLVDMKTCEHKFPIIQYFNLPPPSIYCHELCWNAVLYRGFTISSKNIPSLCRWHSNLYWITSIYILICLHVSIYPGHHQVNAVSKGNDKLIAI